jgi:hypothetical protein
MIESETVTSEETRIPPITNDQPEEQQSTNENEAEPPDIRNQPVVIDHDSTKEEMVNIRQTLKIVKKI